MYGRTLRLTMLLLALVATMSTGCQTIRNFRAPVDAPADAPSGGCSSCK